MPFALITSRQLLGSHGHTRTTVSFGDYLDPILLEALETTINQYSTTTTKQELDTPFPPAAVLSIMEDFGYTVVGTSSAATSECCYYTTWTMQLPKKKVTIAPKLL